MIRLQFSRQEDVGADLIAWFGHGAGFSHVDTVLGGGSLLGARSDVVRGVPAGVQIRPGGYAPFSRILRIDLPASAAVSAAYYEFVRGQLDKPYDMRAILGFAAGRDWRDPGHWFCSELVAASLERSRWLEHRLATPANKVDPDDLVLLLSAFVPVAT